MHNCSIHVALSGWAAIFRLYCKAGFLLSDLAGGVMRSNKGAGYTELWSFAKFT